MPGTIAFRAAKLIFAAERRSNLEPAVQQAPDRLLAKARVYKRLNKRLVPPKLTRA